MFASHKTLNFFHFLICALLISGCASTQIKNIEKNSVLQLDDDEARLWKREAELQEILNTSGFVYQDDQLTEYVNAVLHQLVNDIEQGSNVRLKVYILKDPLFNAFCLANGSIYINTSILAEADNEAQLASILGHEATHFLNRHALKEFRSKINTAAFLSTIEITLGGIAGAFGPTIYGSSADLARMLIEFSVIGSAYGYSRDIEREADKNAFDLIVKAGYNPLESKKVLETLYEVTKDEKNKIPYFYSTHPRTKERIRDYDLFIKELSKTKSRIEGLKNDVIYQKMTKQILLDNVELEIKCNKLKLARKEIEKYGRFYPDDFRGHYFLGALLIQENKQEEAESEFGRSIELNPDFPDNHKGLGMIYFKKGDTQKAKAAFEKYLQLKPDAKDIEYIRGYING